MDTVRSLAPVIDERARTLILGSLPSPISVSKGQYFANPKNQFWTIIARVFEEIALEADYSGRIASLQARGVALWDVYRVAERRGALDANIKNGAPNDIRGLLEKYPGVKRVVLAGGKAEKFFRACFSDIAAEIVPAPSTSPIPGKNIKTLDEKVAIWRKALLDWQSSLQEEKICG